MERDLMTDEETAVKIAKLGDQIYNYLGLENDA